MTIVIVRRGATVNEILPVQSLVREIRMLRIHARIDDGDDYIVYAEIVLNA